MLRTRMCAAQRPEHKLNSIKTNDASEHFHLIARLLLVLHHEVCDTTNDGNEGGHTHSTPDVG